jgi:hypothetical protein
MNVGVGLTSLIAAAASNAANWLHVLTDSFLSMASLCVNRIDDQLRQLSGILCATLFSGSTKTHTMIPSNILFPDVYWCRKSDLDAVAIAKYC